MIILGFAMKLLNPTYRFLTEIELILYDYLFVVKLAGENLTI
jgi:hypothetical protein